MNIDASPDFFDFILSYVLWVIIMFTALVFLISCSGALQCVFCLLSYKFDGVRRQKCTLQFTDLLYWVIFSKLLLLWKSCLDLLNWKSLFRSSYILHFLYSCGTSLHYSCFTSLQISWGWEWPHTSKFSILEMLFVSWTNALVSDFYLKSVYLWKKFNDKCNVTRELATEYSF